MAAAGRKKKKKKKKRIGSALFKVTIKEGKSVRNFELLIRNKGVKCPPRLRIRWVPAERMRPGSGKQRVKVG